MRIAAKPFTLPPQLIRQIKFMSPNIYELHNISMQLNHGSLVENTNKSIEAIFEENRNILQDIKESTVELLNLVDNILLTLGPKGVLLMRKDSTDSFVDNNRNYIPMPTDKICVPKHKLYKIGKVSNIVNVSGAGDSFNIGFITALINGYPEDICISVGFECAKSSMRSENAVPATFIDKDHTCWTNPASFQTVWKPYLLRNRDFTASAKKLCRFKVYGVFHKKTAKCRYIQDLLYFQAGCGNTYGLNF